MRLAVVSRWRVAAYLGFQGWDLGLSFEADLDGSSDAAHLQSSPRTPQCRCQNRSDELLECVAGGCCYQCYVRKEREEWNRLGFR